MAVPAIEAASPWGRLRERFQDGEFALDDLVSFVLRWGAVDAALANWRPVAVPLLLAVGLLRSAWFVRPEIAARLGSS